MKNRNILFLFILIFPVFYLSGISFSDLNLSSDDRLLFKAEFESQDAVFMSTLSNMSMQQLTAYPQKLFVVENGRSIITVNRFGAARIPVTGGLPAPLLGFPLFTRGNIPLGGSLQELAASSDGRWVLYLEPTSPAFGRLTLIEVSSGIKRTISERVELSSREFPAKWSPDSRLFVYSKGGNLFYFPIISDMSVLIDERFRMIGSGAVSSVLWGQQGDFYYFSTNVLYRIRGTELFTRTIYGDFLSIGAVAATFPFDFVPGFDRFWIAPDSGSILISKNGKGLFVFTLGENKFITNALPHLTIPYGAENFNVLWAPSGRFAVVFSLFDKPVTWIYEISSGQFKNILSTHSPESSNAALSPDGTKAIFWGEAGLELWDFSSWQLLHRLSREPVISGAWVNNGRIISGSEKFIEEINISGEPFTRRRICLSAAEEIGFEAGSRGPARILARLGGEWFVTDGRNPWTSAASPNLLPVTLSSDRYRVYLENRPGRESTAHFKNIPMVRHSSLQATSLQATSPQATQTVGTTSLVASHAASSAFPLGRQMQIALCFDLYDDDTGLLYVLKALRDRNIKATFFLNGEFIRRNPLAATSIAEAGHETASLFYAPIDFADTRYRITQEFITQGLARNEDEFFHAAEKELSLLWHPPFYRTSNLISSAAQKAGYTTVSRTVDPGDWLSRDDALRLNMRQVSASQMIEQIMDKRTAGAVIPVRLGLLSGGRNEYLFQRIEVLLDALIRSGCVIVPASSVVER
ncbi:MAG: polysaccharide deacetylase family protein [Treponema sp.]|jgi:peptidoglycan/xylan/chitin deacetylase (PgdA/CDA1 family)|nr:polysaccharide deacetylase family protein [Treponema sp.]